MKHPFVIVLSALTGAVSLALGFILAFSEINYTLMSVPEDCLNCGTVNENNLPIFILMILTGLLLLLHTVSCDVNKNKFGDSE